MNGCFAFRRFLRDLSVQRRFLPLQSQNPSYITDHYPFSAEVFQEGFVDLLVGKHKCWNNANTFQVHPKDAQSFVKMIQRLLDRWTSVVPYIISQL